MELYLCSPQTSLWNIEFEGLTAVTMKNRVSEGGDVFLQTKQYYKPEEPTLHLQGKILKERSSRFVFI
jgi:hypothetical protein